MPFLLVTLTGILTAVIGVINPVLSRVFLDRVLTQNNPDWLYPLIDSADRNHHYCIFDTYGLYVENRGKIGCSCQLYFYLTRASAAHGVLFPENGRGYR